MTEQRKSPYEGLPPRAFWRTGLAEAAYPPPDLFRPRWALQKSDRIVTAGSCFAQHVGRALRRKGFQVIDKEPPPAALAGQADRAADHGYGLYSARYGNIYTARQLRQLLDEAWGRWTPPDLVWERGGRFYDAQRPGIEPGGFGSAAAVLAERAIHLAKLRAAFSEADVFVFTLGLTEAWVHKPSGQVYATAPGTIAGRFDPDLHSFINFRLAEIKADVEAALALLKEVNPALRVLLTVSPVPLTATADDAHVLAATTYSKSVLRACAGELRADHPEIDYFPSYEIVTSTRAGASFFEENLRSVADKGVQRVMRVFTKAYLGTDDEDDSPTEGRTDARAARRAAKGDDKEKERAERKARRAARQAG